MVGLVEAMERVAFSTDEERAALRADLVYELAHVNARIAVLEAMAKVIDKKLAEHDAAAKP